MTRNRLLEILGDLDRVVDYLESSSTDLDAIAAARRARDAVSHHLFPERRGIPVSYGLDGYDREAGDVAAATGGPRPDLTGEANR